ncbi:MAG: hypothetical protein AMXMBFR53_43450 [Gemmatimonadota bacterium]
MPPDPAVRPRIHHLRPPSGGGETRMTAATWVTMVLVMAFIWGGFALALRTAVRKESGKRAQE